MKKTVSLLIAVFLLWSLITIAQKIKPRALTPARGHYKQLAAFNPTPKSSGEPIDSRKFPTNQETIDQRLSPTPVYLQNTHVDDFKIPDGSSQQFGSDKGRDQLPSRSSKIQE